MTTTETAPGIFKEKVTERKYCGDILKSTRRWETSQDSINPNLNISNTISILSDDFCRKHLGDIRYVEFAGCFWDVSNIDIEYPRLRITVGGVYHGKQTETA